ncbi:vitelline membrane outer layer protein 1-like [Rhinoderma darwinii]|uniref:vitelline membrane outer layer protein 1-like n=1 Tax=Rhinoderma darwinii TaxID=43563 RepID=UPI003F6798AF
MSYIFWSFLLLSIFSRSFGEYAFIGIPNGGSWGEWGAVEWCPCGYHAKGFSLKVEEKQNAEDDTALNGIRLLYKPVWGKWSPTLWCPQGHLISFSMQVEPPRKGVDDTAANNLMFQCSDYHILLGNGQSWGHYGRWSGICINGICGMKTKIEPPQGSGDDTALNDVQFICCKN